MRSKFGPIALERPIAGLLYAIALFFPEATKGQVGSGTSVFITTRGPYLQCRTSSSIIVRWRTEQPTDSRVVCGTNQVSPGISFSDPQLTTEHEILLTNLQPLTKYYYTVGNSESMAAAGEDFYFVTAPPNGADRPTRIWFVSDYGFQNEIEVGVRDSYFAYAAATRPADVWLTGGDNDQNVGADADVQNSVFGIYGPLLRQLPIWPAMGNHDSYTHSFPGPYPFYDNFTLPVNGEAGGTPSGSEHYFSFDYGQVHFICLDSITPELSSSPDTPMLQWLQRDLANTTKKWKIAYWHAPPYTKGSHDSDAAWDISGRMIQMRENALPILESHGIDLVLCGHSHVYERSYFLNGHYGYSSTFSSTNIVDGGDGREDGDGAYHKTNNVGAIYVVAAVGGSPYGFFYGTHPAHLVNIESDPGSLMIDVQSNRLEFKFLSMSTEVLDHFTIIKDVPPVIRISQFSFAKNTATLQWSSLPGQCYRIYLRATVDGPGIILADGIQGQEGTTTWSGDVDPSYMKGFFSVATCRR